ncbi:Zinc/iron permease [Annulohypoxylon maeteangense]|uniref:Zinc/iron permease n=1 Tax=Annulohypoxylon maeteangense TaxID=1927788 RepID=UPI0020087F8F|nr:Zinc/iron permease [Annulohypoxylon maeteangense]KAI0887821.1 Zinc/iron permease [Annulohypoxylon maeteangense]
MSTEDMGDMKPVCGSGKEAGEYDLPLHTIGLFLVLAASIFGAGFPVAAKKISWLKVPQNVFFACKHFGTGVLIATAFVHLLPTAWFSLSDPCLPDLFTKDYPPLPGVIMMFSLFCLFVVEMWMNNKMGGHSHGGATGFEAHAPPPAAPQRPQRFPGRNSFEADDISYEKKMAQQQYDQSQYPDPAVSELDLPQSEMPPWFIVFYEQYVRQRLELVNMIRANGGAVSPSSMQVEAPKQDTVISETSMFDEEGQPVDPLVYKRMSMNITLLEGGILFHSVFVGMTVSITIEGFVVLLIAILFHQMFEGLGLGSRIAAVPYPKGSIRPWLLVFAFGTTAPIGQAIGLIARNSYDPNSAFGLIIVGIFNSISSGLLIYAALVDLLAEDFLSEESQHVLTMKQKKIAFCYVLLGAAGMSIVGAFA